MGAAVAGAAGGDDERGVRGWERDGGECGGFGGAGEGADDCGAAGDAVRRDGVGVGGVWGEGGVG